jgi:hypothetical protein
MYKATVLIRLWIKLGKHSNNRAFNVETAVDKELPKWPRFSCLLASGCGKQIPPKLSILA